MVGILGKHILADFYGCEADLDDIENLKSICKEAAKRAGATVVGEASYKFNPLGCTLALILSESHLSLHSWPEDDKRFASIDFYTCGDCDPALGIEYLKERLKPTDTDIIQIQRGAK
jgi:S-adenosylmethionine decarboxylase